MEEYWRLQEETTTVLLNSSIEHLDLLNKQIALRKKFTEEESKVLFGDYDEMISLKETLQESIIDSKNMLLFTKSNLALIKKDALNKIDTINQN